MDFTYTAITKDGHRETATIQAANLTAAGHMLKEQGLMPTEIHAQRGGVSLDIFKKVSLINLAEKLNFVQNLGVMLKAGISISRAMQILVKQTRNARMKEILSDIYSQVESGKSLADALEKYPSVFSNIFFSMVRVGEMSGNLEVSLQYLSTQLQREADLKSKVRGAMIYPSVIVFAMIVIGVAMSIFVLPSLTATFKESGVALPITTQVVIATSDFMSQHAVLTITGMIALAAGAFAFYRTYTGKRIFDIMSLHMLVVNSIVKKVNLARVARILSSLLKSGVPIVQALEVVSQSVSNIPYRQLLTETATEVKLGKALAETLGKKSDLFPVIVIQMLQVGEESGTVEEILEQLATHYEEEVDTTLKNLSSVIEPLLLLVIGVIVGILALALITPIYSISQTIQ